MAESLRRPSEVAADIAKLNEKKRTLEEKLAALERQIYCLEGSYLQDTRSVGNILTGGVSPPPLLGPRLCLHTDGVVLLQGWDNYLSARSGTLKRPQKFKESDRLFSLSSVTSLKVVSLTDCSALLC